MLETFDSAALTTERQTGRPRKGRSCAICDSSFNANWAGQQTCSRKCGTIYRAARHPRVTVSPPDYDRRCRCCDERFTTRRARQINCPTCAGATLKRTAPPFDCPICGTHVIPGQNGVHHQKRVACPGKCSRRMRAIRFRDSGKKRDTRHRTRARKRDAFVAPVSPNAIYVRDRELCQLCGQSVEMQQRVPHPLAPTIDHIIPLARGGTHEPANVQLAHFRCNYLKGDGLLTTLGGGL